MTFSSISSSERAVFSRSGRATFSSTLIHCSRAAPWNRTPKRSRIRSSSAP